MPIQNPGEVVINCFGGGMVFQKSEIRRQVVFVIRLPRPDLSLLVLQVRENKRFSATASENYQGPPEYKACFIWNFVKISKNPENMMVLSTDRD